jgi:hypothetical protein
MPEMHLLKKVERGLVSYYRGTVDYAKKHGLEVLGKADSLDVDAAELARDAERDAAVAAAAAKGAPAAESKLVNSAKAAAK